MTTEQTEKQIRVVALKSWHTAVFNENQMPILTVETFEGQVLSMFLTPEAAMELGESLQRTGEQTIKPVGAPN